MAQKEGYYKDNGAKVTGYELLAIAVCKQAADDYATELKTSDIDGLKTSDAVSIERFFKSDWGQLLSFGMGELILEKVQQKHREKTLRKRKAYTRTKPKNEQRKE